MVLSPSARRADDTGFGLAELAIYATLSVTVLTIVASIFFTTLNTRTQVTDLTRATGVGQLIASSVEEGVRNASGPSSTSDPIQKAGIKAELPTTHGQLLRARVAVGASNASIVWRCQAWFYSSDTGAVYSAVNAAGAIVDPVSFSVVDGSHVASSGTDNWQLLGDGIALPDGVTAFFGAGSDRVVLRFEVTAQEVSLVLIPSTVVKRTLAAGGTGPSACY
jgi:Tfp pilus assembly protein PilW